MNDNFRGGIEGRRDIDAIVKRFSELTPTDAALLFYHMLCEEYTSGVVDMWENRFAGDIGAKVVKDKDFPVKTKLMLHAMIATMDPARPSISSIERDFPWIVASC